MGDWLRRLPPNVQGALWLVSGGFIFTSTSVMIRLLSRHKVPDVVKTLTYRPELFGEPVDSGYTKRLEKARAFLQKPPRTVRPGFGWKADC